MFFKVEKKNYTKDKKELSRSKKKKFWRSKSPLEVFKKIKMKGHKALWTSKKNKNSDKRTKSAFETKKKKLRQKVKKHFRGFKKKF